MTRVWIVLFFLIAVCNFFLERKELINNVYRYNILVYSEFPSKIKKSVYHTKKKFDKIFFSIVGVFTIIALYSVWKESFIPISLSFFIGMAIISIFQLAIIDVLDDKTK